jgi:hypothetical protein
MTHRTRTEGCGRVVSTPASYSGGPGLKSRPGNRLSSFEVFRDFSQFFQINIRRETSIRPRQFPSTSFPIQDSPITLSSTLFSQLLRKRR